MHQPPPKPEISCLLAMISLFSRQRHSRRWQKLKESLLEPHEPLETLDQVLAFIDYVAADLDPDSRYVRELRALVLESRDVEDLQVRMFAGCRGLRHSGVFVYMHMSFQDKLRANLITNETDVSRFESYELRGIRASLLLMKMKRLLRDPQNSPAELQILVAPCSTGAEAYTYAMATIEDDVAARIQGWDIQFEALRAAASGVLDVGIPSRFLEHSARVSAEVLGRVQFDQMDLLRSNLGNHLGLYDLVSCRNFLGYFTLPVVQSVVGRLVSLLGSEGVLVLDSFVLEKHDNGRESAVVNQLRQLGFRQDVSQLPIFTR